MMFSYKNALLKNYKINNETGHEISNNEFYREKYINA